MVVGATPALAAAATATKLTPAEIQSTFFTGEAFTSATPSGGLKFQDGLHAGRQGDAHAGR